MKSLEVEKVFIEKMSGKNTGRPEKQISGFYEVYQKWKKGELTATSASRQSGVSRSTFYRKVNEYERNDRPIDF